MEQTVFEQQASEAAPPPPPPSSRGFSAFLNFRYMITPPLITLLWILSVIAITIGAVAIAFYQDGGLIPAIIGWIGAMIWVRVVFEVMIVLFRINDGIQEIARRR